MTNQGDASPQSVGTGRGWRAIVLLVLLAGLWLLLSGYFGPLLLALGVVSVLFCVAAAWRLGLLDDEGVPFRHIDRALTYWPWLLVEIFKASIDVARRVLDPRLPIHPVLFPTQASQGNDLGQVTYANSITLTPGTVSVDLEPGSILVHAISEDGARDIKAGEMDRRVTRMMGGRAGG